MYVVLENKRTTLFFIDKNGMWNYVEINKKTIAQTISQGENMEENTILIGKDSYTCYRFQAVIVGSGAAGLNAAVSLVKEGQTDIAIITEGRMMGTSRNTGSDKQTYYKWTTCGDEADSVRKMAQTLIVWKRIFDLQVISY